MLDTIMLLRSSSLSCLLLLVTHTPLSAAVVQVSDDWFAPKWPDDYTVWTQGREYEVRWTSDITRWFPGYAAAADVNNVTLWATGSAKTQYQHLIQRDINLTRTLSTRWTIDLSDQELAATDNDWTLRFLPANYTSFLGANTQQVSSPHIRIQSNSTSITTTTAVPPNRTAPPGGTIPSPTTLPTPIQPPCPNGLSAGATAGIAIGSALVALLLAAALWFVLHRHHRRSKTGDTQTSVYPDNIRRPHLHHHHATSQSSNDYFSPRSTLTSLPAYGVAMADPTSGQLVFGPPSDGGVGGYPPHHHPHQYPYPYPYQHQQPPPHHAGPTGATYYEPSGEKSPVMGGEMSAGDVQRGGAELVGTPDLERAELEGNFRPQVMDGKGESETAVKVKDEGTDGGEE